VAFQVGMDAAPNGLELRKNKSTNQQIESMQLNPMFAFLNLGGGEIILILAIVLILFGAKKLPELAKGLGQGIKEFKKATDYASAGLREAAEDTLPSGSRALSAAPVNAQPAARE
jgi:sec-independent protein translocase protein TatA